MSNLKAILIEPPHPLRAEKGNDVPIEIIIQDLDRCRSDPSRWLFGHRDEYGWVRLSNDEAFFAFPLEFMAAFGKG